MPRYYFDFDDGESRTADDTGLLFSSLQDARDQAIQLLTEVVSEVLPDGNRRDFASIIRDEEGRVLFTAKMAFQAEWTFANDNVT